MLKPVRLAMIVAVVLGLLQFSGGISSPLALLGAFIYFAAAFGLWRRIAWCGFGPALWLATQILGVLVVILVNGPSSGQRQIVIITALVYAFGAWIFYRAGKALAGAGSLPSFATPWIVLATLSLVLDVAIVFLRPYVIPTGAMEDTLLIGDKVVVPRFSSPVPSRGDIVVHRYPVDPTQTFMKRIVGVPGDRIRIVNKEVYLNGRKLTEPYAYHKSEYVDSYRDNFPSEPNVPLSPQGSEMLRDHVANGEVQVPPNGYFVLGDNRDSSLDSRYWGFVSGDEIIGEPWIIYWSAGSPNTQAGEQPSGWASLRNIRWSRILTAIHGYPI